MIKKFIPLLLIFLLGLACGPVFQVKPRSTVDLPEINNKTANSSLILEAAILSEDKAVEIFDANLFLAGIIPLEVKLTNQNQTPVKFSEKDFTILDSKGRSFSCIKDKDVINKLLDYYKIKAYNPYSHDKLKEKFFTHSLSLKESFGLDETRQGLLYFKIGKEKAVGQGLKLNFKNKKISQDSLLLTLN
ncbi:MAG: hypothetical protein WAQ98_12770 [Blastocatellia bacterium]